MLNRISKVLGVKKRRKEERIGRGAGARGGGGLKRLMLWIVVRRRAGKQPFTCACYLLI